MASSRHSSKKEKTIVKNSIRIGLDNNIFDISILTNRVTLKKQYEKYKKCPNSIKKQKSTYMLNEIK